MNNNMMNNNMMNNNMTNNNMMSNNMMSNNMSPFASGMDNQTELKIQFYEQTKKDLEEKIRQKEFEIYGLKDKLRYYKNQAFIFNQQMNMNMMYMANYMKYKNLMYNQLLNERQDKNIKNLTIYFQYNGANRISIQCRSTEKIKDVLQKFCCKAAEQANSLNFYYNSIKIKANDITTIDELNIKDNGIVDVVKKDNLSSNKNTELSDEQKSSDDNSSIDNNETEFLNQNINENDLNQKKIFLTFVSSSGLKLVMDFNEEETVNDALTKYCKRIQIEKDQKDNIAFIFNSEKLNFGDNRQLKNLFSDGATITVIDTGGIIGA
jgi:hypothetical protein